MAKKDPRVTAYVARAAPFARPILKAIRAAMHEGCPDVEETVKWGMPTFVRHGVLAGMAAFKAHCAFWFWRGKRPASLGAGKGGAMGQFGRLTTAADLPGRAALVALVREAAALDEAAASRPKAARPAGRRGTGRAAPRPRDRRARRGH